MVPARKRSQLRNINELHQNNRENASSLMSIPGSSEHGNFSNTVPKQLVDVVDLANIGNSFTNNFRHHVELGTLSTSTCQTPAMTKLQPTQIFSNIEIDGVCR